MTTYKLHDYQELGVEFLRNRGRAGLFMDMGLGKTATCLAALEPRHLPVLVVAPKRVAEDVWPEEAEKWRPDLSVSLAAGEPAEREIALESDTDIVVVAREHLAEAVYARRRRARPFATFIVDELSGFKNRAAGRWHLARQLVTRPGLDYVWGLTGTPAPNGYLDLWGQIALLDGGARLGKNITTYRRRYFAEGDRLPNGVVIRWDIREGAVDAINELLSDLCLSMKTEGRITLPPVTRNDVEIKLPPAVKAKYDTFARELVVDLRDLFDGDIHSASTAGALTGRLSQISAGFLYEDPRFEALDDGSDELAQVNIGDYTHLHSRKIDALREVIEGSGGGVLVFYRFTVERDMILGQIKGARSIREPGIIKEWNRGEVPVLVAHPASAGHGLNLQYGGHTIVWTSPTWDLEHWDQANKRLARQGQTEPVVIHTILATGTIDRRIVRTTQGKSLVQGGLLDYLESPI